MAGAAQFRTEHVQEAPRGWRTRTIVPGPRSRHEVRIAFPPGRRRKGAGRVVEILHPADEAKNPRCEISEKAKANPGELLIFGNPNRAGLSGTAGRQRPGHKPGCKCFACRAARGETSNGGRADGSRLAKQREARERAARIRGARLNPGLIDSIRPRDRVTIVDRFGVQHTGRAVMRSSTGGWVLNMGGPHGTPGLADDRNVVKVRKAKANPGEHSRLASLLKKVFVLSDSEAQRAAQTGSVPGVGKVTPAKIRELQRLYKNPGEFSCKHCGKEFTAAEVEAGEHAKHLARHRAERGGTAEHHKRRVTEILARMPKAIRDVFNRNPVHMQVFHDPAIKKFTAVIYDPKFGNLYATGYTKKQAAHALHEVVRKARRTGTWRNPAETEQAVRLFQGFHGRDPDEIIEEHVRAATRLDYTALGDLNYILVETPLGQKAKFHFNDDHVKLACAPNGKQLYVIGGNQNIESCLDAASKEKDFLDLGEGLEVEYLARKVHSQFRPVRYFHEFGEINGQRPRVMYDKLRKQIFFIGGDYFVDVNMPAPGTPLGKISPGIEN